MLFEYLKENPALAAVLAACLAVILVVAGILVSKSVKTKKNAAAASECKAPPSPAAPEEKPTEAAKAPQPTEAVPEAAAECEATAAEENTAEAERSERQEKENEASPSLPKAAETPAGQAERKKAGNRKKSGQKKNKPKEDTMDLDEFKDVPTEDEDDFYDEEDEADRIAKYSGKWVICRVVTANAKSAEVIREGENEEEMFFFELRASNGEKLLTSEEYTTYNGALNGIETHKSNIARGNFKITLSKKGDYIFKLLSGKNLLLCMGEHYATKARCESAIESTKRFAKTAIVDENIQDIVISPPPEDDEHETQPEPSDNGYNGKWVIRANTAPDGEQVFYFELFASNGEKLLSSEEYTTYIGSINGIETHKTNIERGNFRVSLTKRGDYIYKLLNGNGQLLCLGEHYKTKRRCLNAIESVKRFAKNAPILTDQETIHKNS